MTWYLSDLARFHAEQLALEQHGISQDWLVLKGWRVDHSMRLVLDADIIAGGAIWPVFLQYPHFFPDTPLSVFPRGDDTRWSSHQYGPGGELCLEFGPDTWTRDLSGVDVIESAHRLLEGERPAPGQRGVVPSRHAESLGGTLRSERVRLLLTHDGLNALSRLPAGLLVEGSIDYCFHAEATVHVLTAFKAPAELAWNDAEVPPQLLIETFERQIFIARVDAGAALPPKTTAAAFRAAFGHELPAGDSFVLMLQGEKLHYYWLWTDDSVSNLAIVLPEPSAQRSDGTRELLREKKVALIGCGSLGSKWATMLARAGVQNWLLIDDDLLLPGNVVRHELDWRDVGTHKARALARKLKLVNAATKAAVWDVQLGGQIAAASAEAVLKLIGEGDLVLDATANPNVLNILSAVASSEKKPVIWAEVFGGGIGGLIARHRPGLEPAPQHMRRAIENWFGDQSAPPVRAGRSYETGEDDRPLIADDADVSVIAANAVRFSIDLLTQPASAFPHSVYAIGLSAGSVFTEPFDTRPIDVGLPSADVVPATLGLEEQQQAIQNLRELLKPLINEAAPANSDRQTSQT